MTTPARTNPFDGVTLAQLRRRRSLKWRAYEPDVLPLWIAEMDTLLAGPIVTAVHDALAAGDSGYPYGNDYAEAMAEFAVERWGWTIVPDHVRMAADVMTGIAETLGLITSPGDAVVLTPPVYPPFAAFATHLGREIVMAPLGADDRLDLVALERAFSAATAGGRRAALLLASPHNPTGTVHSPAELTALASLAADHGVRVVADEIHAPLTYAVGPADDGPTFTPYLTVPGGERGFAVVSAAKGWNLAGLKAALVVGGAEAAEVLARMPVVVSNGASAIGVLAHTTALRAGRGWLDDHLAGLRSNRQLLADLVAEHLPGVALRLPDATYLAWLDCRALGWGDDPAAVFLDRGRVALNPGATFGPGGAGHVRLNFATRPDVLTEAVRRMGSCLP